MMAMTRKGILLLAASVLLMLGTAVAGDSAFVVSDRGARAQFHAIEAGEGVDLADLYDGETRMFGEGEHQIAATRSGDTVSLRWPNDDDKKIDISCELGTDSCKIITVGDQAHAMIRIERHEACEAGQDCERHEMKAIAFGDAPGKGHRFMLRSAGDCSADSGECTDLNVMLEQLEGVGHGMKLMRFLHQDGTTLRCPEGDTTMQVELEETDDTFLCPKHSVPLVKVSDQPVRERIEILHRTSSDDAE
jgi:hypothetical protein